MKTAHEPPLRAGEDDVLHALVSIIATTRRDWGLPSPRSNANGAPRAGIEPESFGSWPYPRTARISRRPRPPG